jgi:hypothetical protein
MKRHVNKKFDYAALAVASAKRSPRHLSAVTVRQMIVTRFTALLNEAIFKKQTHVKSFYVQTHGHILIFSLSELASYGHFSYNITEQISVFNLSPWGLIQKIFFLCDPTRFILSQADSFARKIALAEARHMDGQPQSYYPPGWALHSERTVLEQTTPPATTQANGSARI